MNVPPGARPFPNSPTGAAARDLPGFGALVADHAPALARTAFLLTGDAIAARLLVVAAVTSVAKRWSTLRWSSPARAATRELFGAFLTRPPKPAPIVDRPLRGETGTSDDARPGDQSLALQVAEAMGALTPRRRALIVARFHEGLPVELAAALCRVDVRTAWAETDAALSELTGRLPVLRTVSGPAPASDPRPSAPDENRAPDPRDPAPESPETSESPEAPATPEALAGSEGLERPETPPTPPATPWAPPAPRGASWAAPESASTSWAAPEPQSPQSARWAAPEPQTGPAASWAPPAPHSGPPATPATPPPAAATPPPAAATPPPVAPAPQARPHPAPYQAPIPGPRPAEDPAHEALRRHLALLAAQAPAVDIPGVIGQILRTARRRRVRRRVVGATAGITVAALIGTAVIMGMSALVDGARDSVRRADPGLQAIDDGGDGDHQDQYAADAPLLLHSYVTRPFRYAYRFYCDPGDSESPDEYGHCGGWRVVSTGFDEWQIPEADTRLFAISPDGGRLAYYDTSAAALVMVDQDDTRPEITDLVTEADQVDYDTELTFSPAGRWLAVGYGEDEGAPRPRLHDFSTNRSWTLPRYLQLLAVSEDGTVTATLDADVRDEPGRVHTTTLVRMRPDGHVLSRVRVEPELFDSSAGLSADGKVLALAVEPAHPRDDGQNRLVMLDARTGKVRSLIEAALPTYTYIDEVRGWVNDREVLVDVSDDDDEYYTYIIDVTSGAVREVTDAGSHDTAEVWAPGTLG
ncbi:hypothetical protein GCM10023194_02600 [Planotetraspora phitsanulokensis]|uniref:hypothetical protein n=1 Tax=Planotetraspora phitsanulokensis TaxID=575192 RepID=UPI0031EDAC69